jgi:hypothetical protein
MKKLFIIFAVLCLAAPAMAADWNFYGSSRMTTFWHTTDSGDANTEDVDGMDWGLQGNSRIGAAVTVNDQVGGKFEYGTGVNVRQLFGTYTFGNGMKLLVGRSWTPLSTLYNNQAFGSDNGLANYGDLSYREDMIRFGVGGFKIAFIDTGDGTVYTGITTGGIPEATAGAGTFEKTLPKIEAKYTLSLDSLQIDFAGGYSTIDYKEGTVDESIDAYILQGGSAGAFGAFSYAAQIYMGQNVDNYMGSLWGTQEGYVTSSAFIIGGEVYDADSLGAYVQFGFTFTEMFACEVGVGYVKSEVDFDTDTVETTAMSYYAQFPVTLAQGVFIVPEIGVISDIEYSSNAGDYDAGDQIYYGAKWQINF